VLVGREGEATWVSDRAGTRRPVVIVGPAGIGKTSLAADVLAGEGTVLTVGTLASLKGVAFHPFRRSFGDRLGDRVSVVAAQVLDEGADAILLDDLQWADQSSLVVVRLLVGRLPLVATVRTGDEHSADVLATLEAAGFERLDLLGLHERPARRLARALRPDLSEAALDRLLVGAGGNPLLLAELGAGGDASPTLTRAMEQRLADLAVDVRDAMERLSVLGRPTEPRLLGPGVSGLVAAGFARVESDLVIVHHALLAEVVVDQLGDRADDVRRGLAEEVDDAEAARLLSAAGDRAQARARALAGVGAARSKAERGSLLALAVGLAPHGGLDLRNRVRASRLLVDVGELDAAERLLDVEPSVTDGLSPVERGTLAGLAAELAWHRGDIEGLQDAIERSLAALEGTGTAEEVRALAASITLDWKEGRYAPAALDRAQRAVELADRLGVDQTFARARLATVLFAMGEPGWEELYEAVLADADDTGDETTANLAVERLVLARWVSGDAEGAERTAVGLVERGPRYDHDPAWAGLVAYRALLGVLLGRDRRSLIDAWSPVLDREPIFRLRPFLHVALALAAADLGSEAEAEARVQAAKAESTGADPASLALVLWAEADVAWLFDRPGDAVAAADEVARLGLGDYPAAVLARMVGAHARLALGLPIAGDAPGDVLAGWAGAPVEWQALVAASEGHHADAVGELVRAADAWRGRDARAEARCRWAAGESARLAELSAASTLLEAAEEVAERTQQRPLAARVRRSMRAMGLHRPAARVQAPSGLSQREEEVLDLVGTGSTSAEIASSLGIAVSTVDSLVRSAVVKLGAANRRAAAARLRDLRGGA